MKIIEHKKYTIDLSETFERHSYARREDLMNAIHQKIRHIPEIISLTVISAPEMFEIELDYAMGPENTNRVLKQIIIEVLHATKNYSWHTFNQEIRKQLVKRDVGSNVSQLFGGEGAIPFEKYMDDIHNYYVYRVLNEEGLEIVTDYDEIREMISDADDMLVDLDEDDFDTEEEYTEELERLEEYKEQLDQATEEYQDIFEYWVVDPWLWNRLKENNEPVFEYNGLNIWGRTSTGQAIYMDGVIYEIANDMKILIGQENDWLPNLNWSELI